MVVVPINGCPAILTFTFLFFGGRIHINMHRGSFAVMEELWVRKGLKKDVKHQIQILH